MSSTDVFSGVKQNQHSVKLWLEAARLETDKDRKSRVLRKALDMIPNSQKLWREAIALEDKENAKILLTRAVQCVPSSQEMWLALAKLCTVCITVRVFEWRLQWSDSTVPFFASCDLPTPRESINTIAERLKSELWPLRIHR